MTSNFSDDDDRRREMAQQLAESITSVEDMIQTLYAVALSHPSTVDPQDLGIGLATMYALLCAYIHALRYATQILSEPEHDGPQLREQLANQLNNIASLVEQLSRTTDIEQLHASLQHFIHENT